MRWRWDVLVVVWCCALLLVTAGSEQVGSAVRGGVDADAVPVAPQVSGTDFQEPLRVGSNQTVSATDVSSAGAMSGDLVIDEVLLAAYTDASRLVGDCNLPVSLLAAIASLGMYTFIAPLLADPAYGAVRSVTPYLWVWGIGGVLGSFLVGPLVDRIKGPVLTFAIMLILAVSLFSLPLSAAFSTWLVMLPIAVWGAVGWALQVPQNNELILARQAQGDGNLAIALNESALYLGSAIGAAAGGFVLLLQMPTWTLAACAGGVAALGALLQIVNLRRQPRWTGKVQAEPYN